MAPRPHRPLHEVAGASIGAMLAAIAGLRRGKAVHPDGVVYEGWLVVPGAPDAPREAQLLAEPAEHRALVRFSRSVGVPRPLPDLLGMSIRVPDAYGDGLHQDLLLVTSADYPVLHHIFLPATDAQQRPYTSSLPYRAGADRFLVGALQAAWGRTREGGTEAQTAADRRVEELTAAEQARIRARCERASGGRCSVAQ